MYYRNRAFAALALSLAIASPSLATEATTRVGGAAMFPSKTIVQNALNSQDHTTLVAAVKAAGLVDTLSGAGPFTVFAPTNEAFAALPAGTVDTLLKPENKGKLTQVLTYHVVSGAYSSVQLRSLILKGGGTAALKTVEGDVLKFMMNGSSNIAVADAAGNVADISIVDVRQSNGMIHVVDKVLMPAG